MNVKVLGPGCANCNKVELITREVLADLGATAMVEHVRDYQSIASYGVLATPGLVIDGVVKSTGRVPSKAEITSWIATAMARGG